MTRDIELRLLDATVPGGEIAVKDLAPLILALQELTTRIGREVIHSAGPGRTKQFMEEFAQLRLRSIAAGSTVLVFSKGPTDKLDVDLVEQQLADDRFWEIAKAISEDRRPDWVTDLIAESAGRLVEALQAAAPKVVLGAPSRGEIEIESAHIHGETWAPKRVRSGATMSAKGRLEKVDLHSHEFRLRDDVGHTVFLKQVEDDVTAAKLVGQWVAAEGGAMLNATGRLVALDGARIEAVDDPAAPFVNRGSTTLEAILASASGPDPDGGIILTDEEFQAFMSAMGR